MPQGIIYKGIGGFYYVKSDNKVVECKARGKFRNDKITPLVGDMVDIVEKNGSYVIDSIIPRKNILIRPLVANVDQAVIIFAAAKPEPNLGLLDRFLILSEYNGLSITICINKIDLLEIAVINDMFIPYKNAGYKIIYTSTLKGYGINELKHNLENKISVLAGPSGVGKSSLLNAVQPNLMLKTGDISDKVERGKHTTRHTELMELETGGFVVDTPGFSSLDIDFIKKEEIEQFFPDFIEYLGLCKFSGCTHISEPNCAVKAALSNGRINNERYNSYVRLYNEISKLRRQYK